jgi:hypothetical protein
VNREWRKSSFSDHNGSCVEEYRALNALRDTKQRSGPTLRVDVARLAAYVRATA